ncbi:MAG: hypothetical protein USCGTAYLOR_01564 [Chromatiales bacterium USCg_Taylor]|nr:MAG: hypothetical protein USCGTAYLOR_01564 [Chromatiales bacterium USCg_Taylor]
MTTIFISHSSADNAATPEMKAWLEAQGHTSLFLDFDPEAEIKCGSGWELTLYRQLRQLGGDCAADAQLAGLQMVFCGAGAGAGARQGDLLERRSPLHASRPPKRKTPCCLRC